MSLDIGNFHRQLYVYKENIPVIVVTQERLHFLIHDKAFEESLPDRLKRAKDIFVFGSAVALRFSDLMALKPRNLLKTDNSYFLSVRSKKTKTYSQVKLTGYAVQIVDRYRKSGKTLLPAISNYNLNKYLKELAEKAGWTESIGKRREKRGRLKEIKKGNASYRFCDLVTTHTMRRTAITTMLTVGMSEHLVRDISGHTAMSKEFFKYVAIAQSYKDQQIDKMEEKLKKRA